MKEKDFFKLYLPALEMAISKDDINYNYHVKGPDWYIENDRNRNEVDQYINENYNMYSDLFEIVDLYFDAKSHYQKEIDKVKIDTYRLKVLKKIEEYRIRFDL